MRFFTWILVAIAIIVLIFVIIFKGPSASAPKSQAVSLASYANTDTVAQLTIDGTINADQEHQQLKVIVDNTNTTFERINGYQGHVASSKTFDSNADAFGVFLRALDLAGFTKGNADPKLTDSRGYCPDGYRYTFELTKGGKNLINTWATSCGGQGTYGSDVDQALDLFKNQVPDYDTLSADFN